MYLGTTLVFGGSKGKQDTYIKGVLSKLGLRKNHPDVLTITKNTNKQSIGIKQAKEAIKFLVTKPYSSKHKVVVIEDAHRLTIQAQNSLLKTLEEPPDYAVIILEAKTEDSLLPTVVSRCRRKAISDIDIVPKQIWKEANSEKLSKLDKDEVINLIEGWITVERGEMLENPQRIYSNNIAWMIEIKTDLENTNVNMRLALENLLIHLEG